MYKSMRQGKNPFLRPRKPKEEVEEKQGKLRQFADKVRFNVEGGRGGSGCFAQRRSRTQVTGGRVGGNGGRGGDVVVEALDVEPNLGYISFTEIVGNEGKDGRSGMKEGKKGKQAMISVPPGTTVSYVTVNSAKKTEEVKAVKSLNKAGDRLVVAEGGRGGLGTGDKNFTAKMQAGGHGQKRTVELTLEIQHDVSILGFRQSGKSSLLASLTCVDAPRSEVSSSTFFPVVGHMKFVDEKKIRLVDFPPFFTRVDSFDVPEFRWNGHLKSSKLLMFVLDASSENTFHELHALLKFVKNFDHLSKRLYFVANKIDSAGADKMARVDRLLRELNLDFSCLSLQTALGLNKLVVDLRRILIDRALPNP